MRGCRSQKSGQKVKKIPKKWPQVVDSGQYSCYNVTTLSHREGRGGKVRAMEFFSGTVEHTLDGKNRMRIPAKFRSALGKEVFFVAGAEHCIAVYSKEALQARLQELSQIRSNEPEKLQARRVLQSSIETVEEDGQGRTTLPPLLRKYAKIEKDIVTIGMGDYLEIWSKEHYQEYMGGMTPSEAHALIGF